MSTVPASGAVRRSSCRHILLALLAEGGGLACAVPTDDHGVPVPPLEADARVLAAGGVTDQHAAFG